MDFTAITTKTMCARDHEYDHNFANYGRMLLHSRMGMEPYRSNEHHGFFHFFARPQGSKKSSHQSTLAACMQNVEYFL